MPYEPWIEVCSQLVEHAPAGAARSGTVERHGGELGAAGSQPGARASTDLPAPQTSDPETERYLLFIGRRGTAAEVAESVPVCVVLDDLHWADGAVGGAC